MGSKGETRLSAGPEAVSPGGSLHEPIAIIGIGCRYPTVRGVDEFWRLMLEGRDAIGPYPGGRFRDLDAEYERRANGDKGIASHLGGFLQDVDKFDAAFFGISPREAAYIDPQQRLLLEVSWDALEDAGQVKEQYYGSRTGVFTGLWNTDYESHIFKTTPKPEFYQVTGGNRSTACGRVSFTFGFEGPSIAVDTACSSSMVAVHLACQSLQLGECDMALGGGANVVLSSDITRLFTSAGMLAADGHCKFGDQSANGFVRSEGAGMVVLKRLSDAVAAGDQIYAVIRGSSVNNDGSSSGYLVTPSRVGQKNMLQEAWRQAGIDGPELCYIEAHGTGTQVGDPVEVGAISDALREGGVTASGSGRVPIGSVKTNIGHTESAAGVAGVIKSALVLHHGVIPGSLHLSHPNAGVDWANGPVEIATATRDLGASRAGAVRMAGASSFGLTGTNSHVVLAEFSAARGGVSAGDSAPGIENFLLPITAYSAEALRALAESWIGYLDKNLSSAELAEICWLAGAKRTHLANRFVAVGKDAGELQAQFRAFLAGEGSASPEAGVAGTEPVRVVFVCPGQGSQWDGMARDLLRENAAFRASFTACDGVIQAETGWSVIERLEGLGAADALKEIDFVQPALFAMSVALAAVWRAAGVEPGAVVGHSMGEVAAAYLAGVLSLEDAAAVICRRSRLMRRLSGSGAMASVELPAAELGPWLESLDGRVSIAAANSPGTTVVSGEAEAVDQLLEWLELKEIFCRRIKVDVASHSALVDPILGELAETLAQLQPKAGSLPLFSTVDGAYVDGAAMDAGYWVRNLREPVRLATATTELVGEGFNCFVELSPHPVLVNALEATLRGLSGSDGSDGIVLPSLLREKPADQVLLRSFGRFWIAGGKLDWAELTGGAIEGNGRRPKLPVYPFERERFWEQAEDAVSSAGVGSAKLSPMLRAKTEPANEPGTTLFTVIADLASLPYMVDHQVGGAIVFPAAGQIEIALEAARVLVPEPGVGRAARLDNLVFKQAIYISDSKAESDATELQLLVRRIAGKAHSFGFALMGRQGGAAGAWVEHSTGSIVFGPVGDGVLAGASLTEVAEEHAELRTGTKDEHYRKTSARGIAYGPAFQLVESFRVGEVDGVEVAQGLLAGVEALSEGFAGGDYLLHPALLDCTFQVVLEVAPRIPGTSERDVFMPSALRRIEVLRPPATLEASERERLVSHAVCRGFDAAAGTMEFDLELRTEAGEILAVVDGLTLQWVDSRGGDRVADDLYKMSWKALGKLPALTPGSAIGRHWLIFADAGLDGGVGGSRGALLARKLGEHGGRSTVVWLGDSFRPLGAGERRLDLLGADEYELPVGGAQDAHRDAKALDELLRLVAAEAGHLDEVLDFWPLQSAAEDGIEGWMAAQPWGSKFVPTLVQAISRAGWADLPRLWLMTEGVQSVADAPLTEREGSVSSLASAAVAGVGAVVMHEHPELSTAVVDLGTENEDELESLIRLVLDESKGAAARKTDREDRLALRGDAVYAARFVSCPAAGSGVEQVRPLEPGEAYKVDTKKPGTLDQMPLRAIADPEPGVGEVAIEVGYVGLNFIDVTKALGIYPGIDPKLPVGLGGECSGRIVAVGAGVDGLRVGEEVVAMTTSPMRVGLTASRVVLPAELVLAKPEKLTRGEAAGLPIAYLTAYYSLVELGRLRKGEWVLIHAGAGGVGLAAAQIALALGAKVIATASSPEKHAFLHGWGVEHVLQSRTLDFADGVMEITGGKGVDIVLNSLAGDFIPKSIEVLARYGRFVELGKRDIYDDKRVGLKGFRNNISYFVVDLAALVEDRRAWAAEMFREVMKAVEAGSWAALPVASYPAAETADAMQFMAQGKHIGKLLVEFAGEGAEAAKGLMVLPKKTAVQTMLFKRDASYIITGGLGGVGAAAAEWMAENGAGCVVVVSRREPGPEQLDVLRRVREAGAVAVHRRTNILDRVAVDALIAEIAAEMPPLRGILHAAAVVDDALVADLTPERFDAVYGPKVRGTWNLHEATLGLELDFFQMFSSIAVPFPQLGHGSYSAANAFLDAFAGYRRGLGLPATTINWSGWLGLGLASATGTKGSIDSYSASGLGSFERDEALSVLGEAIKIAPQQALAVRLDARQVAASYEVIPALLRDLIQTEGAAVGAVASQEHPALTELLLAEGYAERLAKLEEMLRGETSRVLKLAPERIKVNQAFGQMGIDSLMALEFIRRVNASLGLALPATAVFNYPTITQLAAQVLKRLGLDAEAVPAVEALVAGRSAEVPADSQELSDEDALRALMEPGELSSGD